MSEAESKIARALAAFDKADAKLQTAIRQACPGAHSLVQFRDGKPPHCRHCGRTRLGHKVAEPR